MKRKHRYNAVSYLDRQMRMAEERADKVGYNIDDDLLYIECCKIVTDADFENKYRLESTEFWTYFNVVLYRIEEAEHRDVCSN